MDPGRCTLLVVDDDPFVLATLKALLSKEFNVVTADSAEAAMRCFDGRCPDIVLADQRMPGWSGVQLLEWVGERSPQSVRLIMTGLARLEDAVEAINTGRVHRFILKPWRNEELLQIVREAARSFTLEQRHTQLLDELRRLNQELESRVRQRTRELKAANRQLQQQNAMLEKLALTDPLTGLPNRRAMDRLARSEIRRRQRSPGPLALGVIDVDHFKEVNRLHLLPGGDQVLVGLARTLAASVRTADTVGRIGGEEFLVLAPQTDAAGAAALAERLRQAVQASGYAYKEAIIRVTVSVGFAVADAGVAVSYERLKDVAASALSEAKETGRNRCVVRLVQATPGDTAPGSVTVAR